LLSQIVFNSNLRRCIEEDEDDEEEDEEEEDDEDDFLANGVLIAAGSAGWIAVSDASSAAPLFTLENEHPCGRGLHLSTSQLNLSRF